MNEFAARLRFRRDHRWAPGHMSELLDGELSGQPRRRMEHHLGECRECRRLLAGLRLVLDALHGMTPPATGRSPAQLAGAVIALIRDPPA